MATIRRPKIKPTGAMVGGLPTYTKAQFAQARPNGSYQSYLNFIKTRRGITPGPKWPGRGGPGLPTLMSMIRNVQLESPKQIEQRANRMTAAQIAAQRGLATDAAKQAQADAIRAQKAMHGAGQAAAAMNKGLFGSVGGEYNAAATELANLGTGSVGGAMLGTDRNVAATNEALARVGAPSVVASQMAGPGQAGVEAFLGAGLPGQQLVKEGQAGEFGLAGMVNAAQLRSTQEANAALSQSTREIAQARQAAYQEIARGRPQVAAEILQQLQEAQRQQTALAMSLLEARRGALQTGFDQSMTKQELALQKQELGLSKQQQAQQIKQQAIENRQWQQSFNAAQKEAQLAGRQVDENRSMALGYFVDASGRPVLKNGKKIPVPKTTAGGDKTGEPLRARMGQSANYWVKDRMNRGKMVGTKQQLVAYLNSIYPGNPKLAAQIAAATFPTGKAAGGKGGFTKLP